MKLKKFSSRQFIVALAVSAMTAGCGSGSSDSGGGTTTSSNSGSAKTFTIGLSQCNLGEPYRAQMDKDIMEAAKGHPELKVVEKDAQNDSLKQRSQVEEFVQDKVDLIIISPKEAQPLTEPVAKAMDAGIPVIVLDRSVLGDKYTQFIGADNKLIGTALGKWLVKRLPQGGDVVELKGLMTSPPAQDRHAGFLEGTKGSNLKVVFDADMKWLEPNARTEMESALARVPKIDVVFAHNDPGAHGAYLAAQAANRDKGTIFVGIDGLPQEGQAYVAQGIEEASFQYPTGGKEAIDSALKILKKETVPKKIVLPSKFFTKDNVASGGAPIE
jgi:ribose transport system substrate-binding protein